MLRRSWLVLCTYQKASLIRPVFGSAGGVEIQMRHMLAMTAQEYLRTVWINIIRVQTDDNRF